MKQLINLKNMIIEEQKKRLKADKAGTFKEDGVMTELCGELREMCQDDLIYTAILDACYKRAKIETADNYVDFSKFMFSLEELQEAIDAVVELNEEDEEDEEDELNEEDEELENNDLDDIEEMLVEVPEEVKQVEEDEGLDENKECGLKESEALEEVAIDKKEFDSDDIPEYYKKMGIKIKVYEDVDPELKKKYSGRLALTNAASKIFYKPTKEYRVMGYIGDMIEEFKETGQLSQFQIDRIFQYCDYDEKLYDKIIDNMMKIYEYSK